MSNYNTLKTTIDDNIKQNGVQSITGQLLNLVLNQMVTTLGTGYMFAGVATTATNPGSPDAKVFYIANGKGTYTNFGGVDVTEDDVVVLYWDSSWHKVSTGIASQERLLELGDKIKTEEVENIDFAIADNNGKSIFVMKDGAIITKTFRSNDAAIGLSDNFDRFDYAVRDKNDKYIFAVIDGYPRTKMFDGKELMKSNIDETFLWEMKGKPLDKLRFDGGLSSIIHNWGFIGDSLCSGEMEYKENGQTRYIDMYEFSWGQRLCKLCGVDGFNFSQGGQSAKGWIEGTNERTWAGAQTNLQDGYIIALGVNDKSKVDTIYSGGVGNIENDVDITDYTNNNNNTFVGCYAGIIQRVRSVQPKAPIFVTTMPYYEDAETWNNAIKAMSTLFENVFVIDLGAYLSSNREWNDAMRNGFHLNAIGYQWYAYVFATYVDWIIRNNFDKFKEIAFVGTNYKYY